MKKVFDILFFLVLLGSYNLSAQVITLPYECGFEDSVEVADLWHLNAGANGPNCQDQWMVGNLDKNGGYN